MHKNRTRKLIAVGATLSAFAACTTAQEAEGTQLSSADTTPELASASSALVSDTFPDANFAGLGAAFTSAENPLMRSADWPSAGHDWAHTGWNTKETAISKANVTNLQQVWNYSLQPATPGPMPVGTLGTAVTAGDTTYFADTRGYVHARKLADGSAVWSTAASTATPDRVFGAVIQGAPVVAGNAVYVGDSDANVIGLNRTTGAVEWARQVDADPEALVQGDLATYTDVWTSKNYVVFGVSSFENATTPSGDLTHRGSVAAVETGNDHQIGWQLWTTSNQMLPAPKFGAGVGVWSSPAIDPLLGVYIGTGQFYEPGSENPSRESRRDKDLSDSLLRIGNVSVFGGKLLASRQFTANDIFSIQYEGKDWDVGTPPNLLPPITVNNKIVLPVGVGDKEGTYRVLDRVTLQPIWSRKIAQASRFGGFQATAAFANGLVYVAAHETIDGQSIDSAIPPGQTATYLTTAPGVILQQKGTRTNIKALDVATGNVVWETAVYGPMTYAPLIVANGILYHGALDGSIRAFDAANGTILKQVQLGGIPTEYGLLFGNLITAMSIAQGRLLVSSFVAVPYPDGSNLGVVAYGVSP